MRKGTQNCGAMRFSWMARLKITLNLETVVGQVRVCIFSAFWLDATTLKAASFEEEQRRQGAEKVCNRACSALINQVTVLTTTIRNVFNLLSMSISGQLPFLG